MANRQTFVSVFPNEGGYMAKQAQNGRKVLCYISYLRVSRETQGLHGLGIEAQRRAVRDYLTRARTLNRPEFMG